MLLAREISCSRSNVLVPVWAWSSPAESVSRSRCSSVISEIVASYSSFSSSRRAPRATRIFSVSAALREVLGATRVALASLAVACLAGVVLVSAGLPIVAPLAALSAAIGGAWSVVLSGGVGTDVAGVVPTAFASDTGPADLAGLVPATGVTGLVAASAFFAGVRLRAGGAAVVAAVVAADGAAVVAAVAFAVVFL